MRDTVAIHSGIGAARARLLLHYFVTFDAGGEVKAGATGVFFKNFLIGIS